VRDRLWAMDNKSLMELTANLVATFGAELGGQRMPKPDRTVAAAPDEPSPVRPPDVLRDLQKKAYQETVRKRAELAARAAARDALYGVKPQHPFSSPPSPPVSQPAVVGPGEVVVPVGSLVGPLPATKEGEDIREANLRLTRRVNSLEDSRVGMSCAKLTVGVAALFLFVMATLVGSTLALAYAEHKWDVPVFTGFVKGR